MTKAYSTDLRIRVTKEVLEDHRLSKEAAQKYRVSHSSAKRWVKQQAREGHVAPKATPRGRKPKLSAEDIEQIRQHVHQHPDATYPEILHYVQTTMRKDVSYATVVRAVLQLNLRRKKTLHCQPTG